jgi:hypothetical protein
VADLRVPGCAEAAFLRSTEPHARITVDASAARSAPGERGELLGFGLATLLEPAPGSAEFLGMSGGGRETARVRIEPTGEITLFTSQIPHGQGHETTLAQVVATEFGVPYTDVQVVHGDTHSTPFSMAGTGGSRSATFGSGSALRAARKVRALVYELAAGLLGATPDQMELGGRRRIYQLQPEPFLGLRDWLAPYERFWRERLADFAALMDEEAETE